MGWANWASSEDRRLIRFAMRAPMLDREEEAELALSWQLERDEHALKQLTEAHMRLAVSAASRNDVSLSLWILTRRPKIRNLRRRLRSRTFQTHMVP